MGNRVVLAPRNCAEAVALSVSACFLAVAGVVAHGSTSDEHAAISTRNLAAQVQDVRTVSRPSAANEVIGSRMPSVLRPEPPLVLLPVEDQAQAKIAADGTRRGEGVVLVGYSRGAGTLWVGGGLTGIGEPPSASTPYPSGAIGFPNGSVRGVVTAAPAEITSPHGSSRTKQPPVQTPHPPAAPTPTEPPATEPPTTPPTTEPPTTEPPTTEPPTTEPPTTEPPTTEPPTTEPPTTDPPTTEPPTTEPPTTEPPTTDPPAATPPSAADGGSGTGGGTGDGTDSAKGRGTPGDPNTESTPDPAGQDATATALTTAPTGSTPAPDPVPRDVQD